ncbi:MAG: KamA family radical SAM protein [Chromatiaceae bacterium]|nr:KamA family radical SAM protein [Chromatiaceae bacterium]
MTECAVLSSEDPPDQRDAGPCASLEDDGEPPSSPTLAVRLLALTKEHEPTSIRPVQPQRLPRFPSRPEARAFRRRFYRDTTGADWSDWRWQLRHRIRDMEALARVFSLSAEEREAVERLRGPLPVGITPYYASLMSRSDPQDPLRRTHLPTMGEHLHTPGEQVDPLGEDGHTVVPGLVHRYPDRVLFLATPFCSTYCRYCTRSRMVGTTGEYSFGLAQWEQAFAYIESHTEIRDVLISGGDPLALADDKIESLLRRLRSIRHIEFLRIGTKVPVVLPMRITRELTRILRRYHPLWMSIHFTHPRELTRETQEACGRLADAGIPLGSQTVLLKGINDDLDTMRQLMQGLLRIRVRPYYLYQCDPITGSAHFRTPVDKGVEILRGLRGHTTGYAVPTYVIDAPGGGGKIPIGADYRLGREGDDLLLINYEGRQYRYPDLIGSMGGIDVAPQEESACVSA